jgi:hypothetical protein
MESIFTSTQPKRFSEILDSFEKPKVIRNTILNSFSKWRTEIYEYISGTSFCISIILRDNCTKNEALTN